MAEPENQRRGDSADQKLYTLSEISQKTGISMPTLQRYKKTYQDRIPSEGQGRKQRYPENALPVFDEIKNENAGKRGRPRKNPDAPRAERPAASKRRGRPPGAAKGAAKKTAGGRKAAAAPRGAAAKRATGGRGRKAAAAAAPAAPARRGRPPGRKAAAGRAQKSGGLLTLTQISETTGISYPTLVRYVRVHGDRLPSEGKGRARRFHPQAVDVFRQLRQESGRGGRKKGSGSGGAAVKSTGRGRGRAAASSTSTGEALSGAIAQRLKQLEKTQQSLEKKFKGFVDSVTKLFR
jgi:predicted DNA-binding transcriptional regulator AlpA